MNIKAGCVGLPNVGKSTLFNMLTQAGIPAQNYPFCTIDPHVAMTKVPDERLEKLRTYYHSKEIIPAHVEFVDIAGLVKGASKGEGLGNQFLSHIKEVSLIIHVLRCFDDENIINTQPTVDPIRDFEIILFECAQKDLESAEQRKEKINQMLKKQQQQKDINALQEEKQLIEKFIDSINTMDFKQAAEYAKDNILAPYRFLLAKPYIVIANLSEKDVAHPEKNIHIKNLQSYFKGQSLIPLCIALESELDEMNKEDQELYKAEYNLKALGLERIIRTTYDHLGLISFFTCGPKEIHAWTITKGTTIKEAAGEIHSDLEKGFISAQVIHYQDMEAYQSEPKLKEEGKVKTVGHTYIVTNGDIVQIHFNV
jgi:GTP-binding protein YchF